MDIVARDLRKRFGMLVVTVSWFGFGLPDGMVSKSLYTGFAKQAFHLVFLYSWDTSAHKLNVKSRFCKHVINRKCPPHTHFLLKDLLSCLHSKKYFWNASAHRTNLGEPETKQYTTCSISAHKKNPYKKKRAPYGLFHFRKSPYRPSVGVCTLGRYRAGGILLEIRNTHDIIRFHNFTIHCEGQTYTQLKPRRM